MKKISKTNSDDWVKLNRLRHNVDALVSALDATEEELERYSERVRALEEEAAAFIQEQRGGA